MQKTTTFLMFSGEQFGKAAEAMTFYTSLFKDSEIKAVEYYKPGEPGGKEGTVKHAIFTLAGQEYMAIDSAMDHAFTFTPSVSVYVHCETEEELDALFSKLSEGGSVLMPLGNYGFSKMFGWVNDKYGLTWQLDLKV